MDDRDDILSELQPELPQTLENYAPIPAIRQKNRMASASLVLGIMGFSCFPIVCSLLAIIFGFIARSQIKSSGGIEGEEAIAITGIVLGFIPFILLMIYFLLRSDLLRV